MRRVFRLSRNTAKLIATMYRPWGACLLLGVVGVRLLEVLWCPPVMYADQPARPTDPLVLLWLLDLPRGPQTSTEE